MDPTKRFWLSANFLLLASACSPPGAIKETEVNRVLIEKDTLLFEGRLVDDAAEKVRQALSSSSGKQVKKLKIRSAGGDGIISREIGELVMRNRLDVEIWDYCVSGCASKIFVAGQKKIIPDDASLIFHTTPSNMLLALERSGIENAKVAYTPVVEKDKAFYTSLGLNHALLIDGFWAMKPTCAAENHGLEVSNANRYAMAWIYGGWAPDPILLKKYGVKNIVGKLASSQEEVNKRLAPFFEQRFRVNFVTAADLEWSKSNEPLPLCVRR